MSDVATQLLEEFILRVDIVDVAQLIKSRLYELLPIKPLRDAIEFRLVEIEGTRMSIVKAPAFLPELPLTEERLKLLTLFVSKELSMRMMIPFIFYGKDGFKNFSDFKKSEMYRNITKDEVFKSLFDDFELSL
jgi:hypothetical protein